MPIGTKIEGYQVLARNWVESERGLGQRNDGFSLHLTPEDAEKYRLEHDGQGSAECYSRAVFDLFLVIVNEAIYRELVALQTEGHFGIRRGLPGKVKAGEFLDLR